MYYDGEKYWFILFWWIINGISIRSNALFLQMNQLLLFINAQESLLFVYL